MSKRHNKTLNGKRYQVSDLQLVALGEPFLSRTEIYIYLGRGALNVVKGLAKAGLVRETSSGWRRTATGSKLLKILTAVTTNNKTNNKGKQK